jgi:imidazolonepropionase-like amidohydrolase
MADHRFTPWQIERAVEVGPAHLASIKTAIRGGLRPADADGDGITIVAGTDYPPGEPIEDTVVAVREMEFLTDAGLTPGQALRAGTIDAARLLKMADQLGAVEEGYVADLIVTDADPLSDLSALRRIGLVLQGGRVIRDDLPAPAPTRTGIVSGAGVTR